jgi:hypothetical protein
LAGSSSRGTRYRLTTKIVFEMLDQAVSPERGLAACCRF